MLIVGSEITGQQYWKLCQFKRETVALPVTQCPAGATAAAPLTPRLGPGPGAASARRPAGAAGPRPGVTGMRKARGASGHDRQCQ